MPATVSACVLLNSKTFCRIVGSAVAKNTGPQDTPMLEITDVSSVAGNGPSALILESYTHT